MQLIGDKIRTLRRKRGLSQEQLGEMVHFSQSKISKIERGEGGDWDSLSDLRLIAKALGVKLKGLIEDESDDGSDEKEDAATDERS
jgi:transcriptional regulator with XRE-family HTH domain